MNATTQGERARNVVTVLVAAIGIIAGAATMVARMPRETGLRACPVSDERNELEPAAIRPAVLHAPPSDVIGCDA